MNSLSKLKTLYVAGSSFSEGGGLYQQDIKDLYKEIHSVEWNNFHEVTYGYRVAKKLNLDLVMDAKCGGGLERVIRKFYEFIKNKSDTELSKVFFIIEPPSATGRIDLYSNVEKKHFMINTNDIKSDQQTEVGISFDYVTGENLSETDLKDFFRQRYFRNVVLSYLQDFYDPDKYEDKITGNFIFMVSHMLYKKLNFLIMPFHLKIFRKNDLDKHLLPDIFEWTKKNKLTIENELDSKSNDGHPGYFGHKEFSEVILNIIKYQYYE